MKNKELRERIRAAGLFYWQVAEKIGIASTTFSVWLRYELTPDRQERIENAIASLTSDKGKGGADHGRN